MIITSKTNNVVKYIKSLENKKNRDENNTFVIEGVKVVTEIINSKGKYPFEYIVYSRELLEKGSIGNDILEYIYNIENMSKNYDKDKIISVSKEIFEYISDTVTPQGILIVAKKNINNILDLANINVEKDSFIILDNVADSGNLGTIIRSSNSFNIKNIICLEGTADVYSPKVVRSTMGAILNTNIYYVSKIEIIDLLSKLKALGYNIIGTKMNSDISIKEIKNISKAIFVMGNEANGISKEIENICNEFVKIPMEDTQESLNVGVAASIIMYEKYIRGN